MGVTESLSLFFFSFSSGFLFPPDSFLNHLVKFNQSKEGSPDLRKIKPLHISEIRGSRADKRHQTLCPHRDKGKKRGVDCICFQRITRGINAINRNLWSGLTSYQAWDKNLCVRDEIRPSEMQGTGEQHRFFSCWQRDMLLRWNAIFYLNSVVAQPSLGSARASSPVGVFAEVSETCAAVSVLAEEHNCEDQSWNPLQTYRW